MKKRNEYMKENQLGSVAFLSRLSYINILSINRCGNL